jgi:hypothetical protein
MLHKWELVCYSQELENLPVAVNPSPVSFIGIHVACWRCELERLVSAQCKHEWYLIPIFAVVQLCESLVPSRNGPFKIRVYAGHL